MVILEEKELLDCCGSAKFAKELALASPFASLDQAITTSRHIWFNMIDVYGWLEAFAAHPQIGQWSKAEQSIASATVNESSIKELADWNARYKEKFGFVFLICASGRTAAEILIELKKRYSNRPIVELEIAAQEEMKITELRLAKLFLTRADFSAANKAEEVRGNIIGGDSCASSEPSAGKTHETKPPITTHVLDISQGLPAAGVDVHLEIWKGLKPRPSFGETDGSGWVYQDSSVTDKDGQSGHQMGVVEDLIPGFYRITFNTGKYFPAGFFPYASIVFEIKESQKREHFHIPLLLSPFSFSTYRGN